MPHKKKLTGKHSTKKRSADSESDSDDEEHTSDDSRAVYRAKKEKRRRIELPDSDSEDLETIDQDASEPPAEEVDMNEGVAGQQPSSEPEVSIYHHSFKSWTLTIRKNDDDLNKHQRGDDLEEQPVKKETTLDLLTIMSDRVKVKFKMGDDKYDTEVGRWCMVCK
jgi:hypothetical protein